MKKTFFALLSLCVVSSILVPLPPWFLDVGLSFSLLLALVCLAAAIHVKSPMEFSGFPSAVLFLLVFRLSLNVSSTRLIITEGAFGVDSAGKMISGFSQFVMKGDVVLGLSIFLVILIVNFLVITKGATRMAEVGARFALDSMPGRQLAIDSDISAGYIDKDEALRRRKQEQREVDFYGALDGVSKFVRGDAIAGLLITFLNLMVGSLYGYFYHSLSFGESFQVFAILTVGDGLVSQIPALLMSVSAAVLLAKRIDSSQVNISGFSRLDSFSAPILGVSIIGLLLGVFSGLPFVALCAASVLLGGIALFSSRNGSTVSAGSNGQETDGLQDVAPNENTSPNFDDRLQIVLSCDLAELLFSPVVGLEARITNIKDFIKDSFGVSLPEVRIIDSTKLGKNEYEIYINNIRIARGQVYPGHVLVLGTELINDFKHLSPILVNEPVFSAQAFWVEEGKINESMKGHLTLITSEEVLSTHFLEVLKRNLSEIFDLRGLEDYIEMVLGGSERKNNARSRKIFNEIVPEKVSKEILLAVLQQLLEDQINIRNIFAILECLSLPGNRDRSVNDLCDEVRVRLKRQIANGLVREDSRLALFRLSDQWEAEISACHLSQKGATNIVFLPPERISALEGSMRKMFLSEDFKHNGKLVIACQRNFRRFLNAVAKSCGVEAAIIAFEEIPSDVKVSILGSIE
ncbi:MAG: FHIPEP family type III secretion protein [Mangrovicoccus sp.]